MTGTLPRDAAQQARDRAKPASLLTTGARLPEARWAAAALLLFAAGWALQLADGPPAVWWTLHLACYASGGWQPALSGLRALREKTLDLDLLMIVAAIAAASIGQVFDGALLIVIFATSGALEAIVTRRTADSVNSLLDLAPEHAVLVDDQGREQVVDTERLRAGDVIRTRPGERIGADGTVLDGTSEVDQQAVTGESVPVVRGAGDAVLSGTVNGTGTLLVRVAKPASESVIARIVALVEQASETKARRQLFIDKVEQRYSLGVVVATLLVFTVPLVFTAEPFAEALLRAITFMIVASPCAVVLSTMPPLLASIANAGRHGVLVKSATALEDVGRTDTVAFDKTGTLTEGHPEVSDVHPADGCSAEELLRLAAAAERHSEHPLGSAVVDAAEARGLAVPEPVGFRALPGRGVTAEVEGRSVTVQRGEQDPAVVGTVVAVERDGRRVGTIRLTDRIRADAAGAVRAAGELTGNPTHLLTGDNERTAQQVAASTGVDVVHADLLPEDKSNAVSALEAEGRRVMLVGDGINDAPALAGATAGVAMGRHGSDLAVDTAQVIVVGDELRVLPNVIALSRRARRYVVANLVLAGTVIAVLVTWDLVHTLPLPLAVAGHEGSTVLVALNGARLLCKRAWSA
ncbi:heavy metal translocating P-type ATPase [Salinifilum ghardaiensis]